MTRIACQIDERYEEAGEFDVVITYDIEGEEYPAEPYSWGGGRGNDLELYAEVFNVRINDLHLTRDDAERVFGKQGLRNMENDAAERAAERYLAGDMEAA